ncbi:Protein CMSS1 [Varanus komodoensis]|nr:Protein CMSS1 [Varanus komodoensis]
MLSISSSSMLMLVDKEHDLKASHFLAGPGSHSMCLISTSSWPTECILTAEKEEPKDNIDSEMKPKRRRKKKISDMLAKSSPKPGSPEDLQQLLKDHFGAKRSVIELEELKLPDACFLPANDLTHSFSSYLKEICPKWAKLRKNHTEKSSVVMLVICSSALRCLELIKSITAFKGDGKIMKLFAKHIKVRTGTLLL